MSVRSGVWTRSRSLTWFLLGVLGIASLRPNELLDRLFAYAATPSRLFAEIAAPVDLLRSGEAHAAAENLFAKGALAREWSDQALAREQQWVMPQRAELTAGRRFVHAEVARSGSGDLDTIDVRLATIVGVAVGQPVVIGEHYVGRVASLDGHHPGNAKVELITGRDFRVGAEVIPEHRETGELACRLVAGGLAGEAQEAGQRASGEIALGVRTPSRRRVVNGEVRVHEPALPGDESGNVARRLAEGFLLGELESPNPDDPQPSLRILPGLDYESGLHQVLVVTPPTAGELEVVPMRLETFEGRRWTAVRSLGPAQVELDREGILLAVGALQGARRGLAVSYGAHFVGRIDVVEGLSSGVRTLGDPGLALHVLARLEGEDEPRAIGQLVSLGRDPVTREVRMRWFARVALDPLGTAPPRRAWLYTGSGQPGVPRGLLIGEVELPG
ncbi:MAG: hypothetical protein KDC14_04960, partial [Planctomycetes bacterium]|nr:hypothetical protein [Planctomycetota bacterium]